MLFAYHKIVALASAPLVSAALITSVRLLAALLLLAVQWYVLRAFLRIIRSLELKKERLYIVSATALFVLMNVPLVAFMVESVITPRATLLYSPPPEYESTMRPMAYAFFVWTLGSLLFAAASPIAMGVFAAVQFFRNRGRRAEGEATVEVLDLSRRRFLRMALLAVASMPFAVSAYGAVAARSRRVVERVVIPIPGLPPQLDGLTIVQMSDIHSGMFMTEAQMDEHVRTANELEPDIVALTGDFVATNKDQVAPFINAMSKLRAKRGVFGCLGNHDMFGAVERIAKGFEQHGFKLLRNRNEIIDIDGAKLNVIGVDYIGRRARLNSLGEAIKGISLEGTTLLLAHSPNNFEEAARAGIDLTLSGHTHGGQIALNLAGLVLTPAALATMFLAGLFRIGDSHLYVNRGLGTTGPPIRINAPPEITHITLRPE
ncbi:MAG TPA: metallophosphoesterase [Blastocatellia bacterium]|nr:metallophosphoesterase [Blastocatellia bacterium]